MNRWSAMSLPHTWIVLGAVCAVLAGGCPREDRIHQLARTINDNPTPLHGYQTASVNALVGEGKDAIPTMLELMASGDEDTRRRADYVLGEITFLMCGSSRAQWTALCHRMGDFDCGASEEQRLKSVSLWRDWCAKGFPGCSTPNARSTLLDRERVVDQGHLRAEQKGDRSPRKTEGK
jgi:hypothetical protein